MMNLGPFTPLIILMLLVALTFWVVMRFSKWRGAKKGFWILGGYGVILLISVIIYYFIPVSAEETERARIDHPGHVETFSGVLSGTEDVASIEEFLLKEWEFDYDEDTFRIESRGDMNFIRVAVERTESDGIKAAFYRTPLSFNGMEIENKSIPLDIQLTPDRLEIVSSQGTEEVYIASFSKEFPMHQFNDQDMEMLGFGMEMGWSEQLLYLQVPEDIEISGVSGVQVEYVN